MFYFYLKIFLQILSDDILWLLIYLSHGSSFIIFPLFP